MTITSVESLTYEQKATVLESNGWQTLWSKDNWIKKIWLDDRKMNIDWAGETTDSAFERCLEEIRL